jgi:uncharacterized protein
MQDWATRRRAIEDSSYLVNRAGPYGRWRKLAFRLVVAVLDGTLRLTPIYARGQRNALDLRKVELELALPDLPPAFDGYRILQLSDTHLDHFPELAAAARALLDGVEVDMLAVTGDVHGHPRAPLERSIGLLMEALAGVRVNGPRLAILGNHDPASMAGLLERAGFDVLVNRSILLRRGDDSLRVTGLDDVHSFYTEAALAALGDHDGEFRIALVHSAEVADDADAAGYAFYLCGHTHGGQICLPGGRPLVTHLKRCRHAASGLWRQGRMVGYTSRGLGVSDLPMRFNTRGEVVVITLRRPAT